MFSSIRFRLGVATLLAALPLAAQQKYQITKFYVPPPPRNFPVTKPAGINDQGEAAGIFAFHVGDLGDVQGFLRLPDGTLQYPITDPNDAQGRDTNLTGINDSEVISGYYSNSQQEHGFLWSNGIFTDISEIQNGATRIYSLNNSGDFCGAFGQEEPLRDGFISIGGNLIQVNAPNATYTRVSSLGSDGSAVGIGFGVSGLAAVSFVRGPKGALSTFQAKNANPAFGTFAMGINTQAQLIVGYYYDESLRVHGFVLHYTRPLDELDALAVRSGTPTAGPAQIDATVIDAHPNGNTYITGVNANGVIVGYWQDPQDSVNGTFGFIGTPIQ